jgi:hypothetical protein
MLKRDRQIQPGTPDLAIRLERNPIVGIRKLINTQGGDYHVVAEGK